MSVYVQMIASWKNILQEEFPKPYFKELLQFILKQYKTRTVYPMWKDIYNAFNSCTFEEVSVVVIGQDPYHGMGQANGLSFSVQDGMKIPPSLKNIFKEIESDLNIPIPQSGNLERWAQQGVLLLNATLTVEADTPGSHQKKGWEEFTDVVIRKISEEREHVVFILWGAYAQKKVNLIDSKKHLILQSPHPSPFSAYTGFFGNKHFSKTNAYLKEMGKAEIDW